MRTKSFIGDHYEDPVVHCLPLWGPSRHAQIKHNAVRLFWGHDRNNGDRDVRWEAHSIGVPFPVGRAGQCVQPLATNATGGKPPPPASTWEEDCCPSPLTTPLRRQTAALNGHSRCKHLLRHAAGNEFGKGEYFVKCPFRLLALTALCDLFIVSR